MAEDFINGGFADGNEFDAYCAEHIMRTRVCRYCGKGNLHWKRSEELRQWRLFTEDNKMHSCWHNEPAVNDDLVMRMTDVIIALQPGKIIDIERGQKHIVSIPKVTELELKRKIDLD